MSLENVQNPLLDVDINNKRIVFTYSGELSLLNLATAIGTIGELFDEQIIEKIADFPVTFLKKE